MFVTSAAAQTDIVIRPGVETAAREAQARLRPESAEKDMVVVDFRLRSDRPRLYVITPEGLVEAAFRVSHGRGSDLDHDGYLDTFSDVEGSLATPGGGFLIAEQYWGQHGLSLRLDGLEPKNANSRARAIVVHSAWYAEQDFVDTHAMLGRSNGCLVLSGADLADLIERIDQGAFLYVTN